MQENQKFSDYIIYADESGDHSLISVNPHHPVFVLAFCIFKKSDYTDILLPKVNRFKFDFWGHDLTVLHNREIRRPEGDFGFLQIQEIRERFFDRLNQIDVILANKKTNSCGLQLADLIAHPIGRHVIDPNQENRSFKILNKKIVGKNGKTDGYGLKIFPRP